MGLIYNIPTRLYIEKYLPTKFSNGVGDIHLNVVFINIIYIFQEKDLLVLYFCKLFFSFKGRKIQFRHVDLSDRLCYTTLGPMWSPIATSNFGRFTAVVCKKPVYRNNIWAVKWRRSRFGNCTLMYFNITFRFYYSLLTINYSVIFCKFLSSVGYIVNIVSMIVIIHVIEDEYKCKNKVWELQTMI